MQVLKGNCYIPTGDCRKNGRARNKSFCGRSEEGRLFSQATYYDTQQKKSSGSNPFPKSLFFE